MDKRFYSELLHIIGLTEIKDGGKKLIGRHKEGERMLGSILEDTIMQLDARDKLDRVKMRVNMEVPEMKDFSISLSN
ncbi:MAG: hypothetical protein IPH36_22685 [Saprospiraceae bacterium]|nr:hypothetical protein [Saprospiraceae bacterium]